MSIILKIHCSKDEQIDKGGFGSVSKYRCDTENKNIVAVKEVPKSTKNEAIVDGTKIIPLDQSQLDNEMRNYQAVIDTAKRLGTINNIVELYDYDENADNKYFIMKNHSENNVNDEELREYCTDISNLKHIMEGMMTAINTVHQTQVDGRYLIHNDIKFRSITSSNFLFIREADRIVPKLFDFGCCAREDPELRPDETLYCGSSLLSQLKVIAKDNPTNIDFIPFTDVDRIKKFSLYEPIVENIVLVQNAISALREGDDGSKLYSKLQLYNKHRSRFESFMKEIDDYYINIAVQPLTRFEDLFSFGLLLHKIMFGQTFIHSPHMILMKDIDFLQKIGIHFKLSQRNKDYLHATHGEENAKKIISIFAYLLNTYFVRYRNIDTIENKIIELIMSLNSNHAHVHAPSGITDVEQDGSGSKIVNLNFYKK